MKELAQSTQDLLGLQLTTAQVHALSIYEKELIDWNERVNLTAIREPEKIRIKHFLDSFTCLLAMRGTPMELVIDIGSGAGFPGIPLKIVCPNMQLTLVESIGKKADFCSHIVQKLCLSGVNILCERAEIIGQDPAYREKYDWAVARAVAEMPILAEYLLPLVNVGGKMLAMKGESALVETQASEKALRLLGGRVNRLIPVTLPGVVDERFLVVVNKVVATPRQYPRRAGVPVKKPL